MSLRTISDGKFPNAYVGAVPDYSSSLANISEIFQKLLLDDILPLWSTVGIDVRTGGFCETISGDCTIPYGSRRVRVSARQVYAFCVASELGWNRNAAAACVRHGSQFLARYRNEVGLLYHVLAADGSLEGDHDLYDQAFLLLAYAHAYRLLNEEKFIHLGRSLLVSIRQCFDNPLGGFVDATNKPHPLRSNPHMHLLESALAWAVADPSELWRDFANELVSLFTARFFDSAGGFVREAFDSDWRPIAEGGLYRVEPGHNFEWAWLLLRWESITGGDCGDCPHRMVDFAETHGYDEERHVAINEVWSDGSPCDSNARLWPQTERLKAWLAVAKVRKGKERWLAEAHALDAAQTLLRYLSTDTQGLWHDLMTKDGRFRPAASPASSLYHIMCAFEDLARYVAHATSPDLLVESQTQQFALEEMVS